MYDYNLGIRFEKIVKNNKYRPALKFDAIQDNWVSYGELNSRANQLARYLITKNIKINDVVCISGIKRTNTFACILACIKIGAIYTILDFDSPIERLTKIINKCKPKILILDESLSISLRNLDYKINTEIMINKPDSYESELSKLSQDNLLITEKVTSSDPAYIMFTSGSTGFPKGAVITHGSLLNMICWSIQTYKITVDDIFTNINPLFFDNSVFDFYSSLFSGASLAPFSKKIVTNPKLLIKKIDELQCTSWFSVPTMMIFIESMKLLNKKNLSYIKRFIFGGEGYPKTKLKKLFDTYGYRADIYNVYGPTECTCICSSYKISGSDFENLNDFPPLGKISDNFSYVVLDENNEKVKRGDRGELFLLGPNIGKGYYNDHQRTENAFIQNPHNHKYAEVMYKTGDIVKYNPNDKKLYIYGRKDNQVKHLGYRIELEEVEIAISCLKYILQAVVFHNFSRGLSQLIAIVVVEKKISEDKLRLDLKKIIPTYMIPSVFYFEEHLPKNQNGKIDRTSIYKNYIGK